MNKEITEAYEAGYKIGTWFGDALAVALKKIADDLLEQSVQASQHWQPVGDIRREAASGYVIYEELGKRPNIVEGSVIVIEETQKALPAPTQAQQQGSEDGE